VTAPVLIHIDRGFMESACGVETTGAWLSKQPAAANCPLCHLMNDRVPVVPGKEITLRRSTPPHGVRPDAHYAGPFGEGVTTMPEFVSEHRAAATHPIVRLLIVAALVVAALVATAVIAFADPVTPGGEPKEPSHPEPSPVVTVAPPGPPANDD
jgi:hypothetical protein